jgi:pyruvate formate lyase activating enzyme
MKDGKHTINRAKCIRCGACVPDCPTRALTLCGRDTEAAEVIQEVLRDRVYYRDDGGMTISGGEPLMQREFTRELAHLAKREGINVALETNLCYTYKWLDDIKKNVDIFLVDWKETDPDRHFEYVNARNDELLANLKRLHDEGFSILLRCPIIPGYNDREEHFAKIAEITKSLPNLLGAELLPYHNLGVSKNDRFGLKDEIKTIALEQPEAELVDRWIQCTRDLGGRLVNE